MPTVEQIHEARRTLSQIEQYARRLKRDAKVEPLMEELAKLMGRMWLAQARIIVREMNRRKVEAPLFEASPASWMDNIVGAAFADTASFGDSAEQVLAEAYGVGMVSGAGKIGIQGRFDLKNPRAVDVVRGRGAQLVKGINAETKSQMTTLLEQAASEGWSYTKTAKAITEKFKGFAGAMPQQHIRNRATLVAVTEVGQGYIDGNRAVYDVLRDEGLPMVKRWDDMGDARVSDGCRDNAAAGWIAYDKEFPSGDMAPLRFPGCRCDLEADMYDPSVHGGQLASHFPNFTDADWQYVYKEKMGAIADALANRGLEVLNRVPSGSGGSGTAIDCSTFDSLENHGGGVSTTILVKDDAGAEWFMKNGAYGRHEVYAEVTYGRCSEIMGIKTPTAYKVASLPDNLADLMANNSDVLDNMAKYLDDTMKKSGWSLNKHWAYEICDEFDIDYKDVDKVKRALSDFYDAEAALGKISVKEHVDTVLLDYVLDNSDRHAGNFMYYITGEGKDATKRLLPYDHSLAFLGRTNMPDERAFWTIEEYMSSFNSPGKLVGMLQDQANLYGDEVAEAIAEFQTRLRDSRGAILDAVRSNADLLPPDLSPEQAAQRMAEIEEMVDNRIGYLVDVGPDDVAAEWETGIGNYGVDNVSYLDDYGDYDNYDNYKNVTL